jgi:hypothetical protein
MSTPQPFAEVIESSLQSWIAQTWQWDAIPSFGSLVTIAHEEQHVLGIIYAIHTGSQDPHRKPVPYQKTEYELKRDHPHIFEFLQTTFSCLTVGFYAQGAIQYQIPTQPPKIHNFITPAPDEIYNAFFHDNRYLHMLFDQSHRYNIDELLLTLLQNMKHRQLLSKKTIKQFIDRFSLLTNNDYHRLKCFLHRATPIIATSMHE